MKMRLLPEAERDLEIGANFYESQRLGLGSYVNDCLTAYIESLRIYAGIHETYRGFQRSLSKRFPFSIYYILSDDCVDIYAVRQRTGRSGAVCPRNARDFETYCDDVGTSSTVAILDDTGLLRAYASSSTLIEIDSFGIA